MKANRTPRALRPDTEAVSSVVSAVLVFVLFSTAFGMWMFTQFPTWVEDRETSHQYAVRDALADIQSGLERLSASESAGPVTAAIPLAGRPIALLGGVPANGHLFVEDGSNFDATFTAPRLHIAGDDVAGTPTASPQTITNIEVLNHLHLSLDTTNVNNANSQAWMQASLSDGTTTFTARLVHAGTDTIPSCSGRGIALTVTTSTGTRQHTILCEPGPAVTDFTVDILDSKYGLVGRLGDLDTFSLSITTGSSGGGAPSASGTFLAVWNTDGHTQVAGTGTSSPGYTVTRTGARVTFEPSRARATPEALSWEFGAIVAHQKDADGHSLAPSIDMAIVNGVGTLRWTLTHLTGSGDLSGGGTGTLEVTHQQTDEVVLSATAAQIALDTPGAASWRNELAATIIAAGASSDAAITGTGNDATLTLTSTTVTEWVLQLRIIDASVSLR